VARVDRRTFNKLAGFAGIGALIGPQAPAAAQSKASGNPWERYFMGTAYYPEWWEPSEWEIDFRQMQEVGINAVRMGEFAWAIFEPSPGRFEFEWMDAAIAAANRYGISVILGTPTASVPPWLYQAHPDVLSGNEAGLYTYGGRKGYCTSSQNYLDACARVVTALAEHYGNHSGVIGWQLDNEPGYPFQSFDPASEKAFRAWLQKRYGTLDALNRAWNGAFWSNRYSEWSQIVFPTNSAEGGWQPAITLAYLRFFSDSFLNHLRQQASILRRATRNQFVATNWPAPAWSVDVFTTAAEFLDITAWDNYVLAPGIGEFQRQYTAGFNHDFSRCAGPHQRFFCAEQIAYVPANVPDKGLRLQAYINLAHGSHGHLYFEWRRPLAGNEQFRPSFIKGFDGSIRDKALLQQIGREFADLSPRLASAITRSDVALLYSFDNEWSQGFGSIGRRGRPYNEEEGHYYNGFKALQRNIDIVPPSADISPYKLIVAPNLNLIDDATIKRLRDFVSGGGTLVINDRAATQNMDGSMRRVLPPGPFADMAGVSAAANGVDFIEYPVLESEGYGISFSGGETTFHPHTILESLTLKGAEAIAAFRGGSMEGRPAVTRNRYGQGRVFYVGTDSTDGGFYESLARIVGQAAGLSPLIAAPYGVEVVSRENSDATFYFLLNLTENSHPNIRLPRTMENVVARGRVTQVSLEPFDVAVLSAAKTG
jgi:beta-galactosidase